MTRKVPAVEIVAGAIIGLVAGFFWGLLRWKFGDIAGGMFFGSRSTSAASSAQVAPERPVRPAARAAVAPEWTLILPPVPATAVRLQIWYGPCRIWSLEREDAASARRGPMPG